MAEELDEDNVIQVLSTEIYEAHTRAEIDTAIATAHRFPRNEVTAANKVIACVAGSLEVAKSCKYMLPRAGKHIEGPSVHLARIIAQKWGNLRVWTKTIGHDGKTLTAEGICHDLETNYAFRSEFKIRITGKDGKTYSDDMLVVTGMNAQAKALRNAVFAVVPKELIDKALEAADEKVLGKLSDATTFIKNRNETMDMLVKKLGIPEDRILKHYNRGNVNSITVEDLKNMIALAVAIKDGFMDIASAFPLTEAEKGEAFDAKIKAKKADDDLKKSQEAK